MLQEGKISRNKFKQGDDLSTKTWGTPMKEIQKGTPKRKDISCSQD
jgi:hypothetical protein